MSSTDLAQWAMIIAQQLVILYLWNRCDTLDYRVTNLEKK